MADRFPDFLEAALSVLATEWPVGSVRLARTLGARVVALRVGDDACGVVGGDRSARVLRRATAGDVRVDTDRATLAALVDGEVDVLTAARADQLRLRGTSADLATFDDALALFVHGAVRCAAMPALWERYRNGGAA